MKNILSILLAAFLQFTCTSQEVVEKSKSLEPVLKTIKTIDPKDEDFSDLQFLKKIIERDSVQVIMLGEQKHGDGSTFLAKSRLIKFLHKEVGFDVLAFESGLFDCTYAWDEIKRSGNYAEEIKKAIYPMWVNSNECFELVSYLQSTLKTKNPIELSGFDPQLTGYESCQLLINEFFKHKLNFLSQGEKNLIVKIVCLDDEVKSGKDKTYNNTVLDKVILSLDSLTKIDTKYEYWKLVIEGVKFNYNGYLAMKFNQVDHNDAELINARDMQMGKNLVWLVKNKYRNRKIIVWAANFHIFRRSGELSTEVEEFQFINSINKKTTTMGDILFDSVGKRMYSIGFTQQNGVSRNIQKQSNEEVPESSEFSIENILGSTEKDLAFIDLRGENNPGWLKDEFISNMRSRAELKGKWSNVTDGIFFIKDMKPSSFGNE